MKINKKLGGVALISFMLGASLVYLVYGQTAGTFWISGGIYPRGDITVWKEGSNVFAKDAYGQTLYTGTDDYTVITSALGALTAGRTRQETIVLIGNFLTESYLAIPNYTIFDFSNAYIKSDVSNAQNVIYIPDYGHDIDIIGGTIDGDAVNQLDYSLSYAGIRGGLNTSRVTISNVYIHDALHAGIVFTHYATDLLIQNCVTENCGNYYTGGILPHGVYVDRPISVKIKSHSSRGDGMHQGSAGIKVSRGYNTLILNCEVSDAVGRGIELLGEAGLPAYGFVLENSIIQRSGECGILIRLAQMNKSVVSNCIVVNNYQTGYYGSYNAGVILEGATNIILSGIHAYDTQGTKTQDWGLKEISGADLNMIMISNFRNNDLGGLTTIGANTQVNLCWNGTTWIS